MRVLDKSGKPVPHVYCIGDANGKLMLAHAASAQVRMCQLQSLNELPCDYSGDAEYTVWHAGQDVMLQGISAVEQMCGREHVLNHLSVPAACFTHPEVCT